MSTVLPIPWQTKSFVASEHNQNNNIGKFREQAVQNEALPSTLKVWEKYNLTVYAIYNGRLSTPASQWMF